MIKKSLESVYSKTVGRILGILRRLFGPLSKPSAWIRILYILGMVAFMAGAVDAVFFPVPNQGFIVYPQRGAQSVPETVIDSFIILLGAAGIYVTYLSGRQTTRPRMVSFYLGFALLLIALAVFMGIFLANMKG